MTQKQRRIPWRKNDPFFQREQEKYERAVPSREFLQAFLEERGVLMTLEELCDALQVKDPNDVEALRRRLRAMERDGQLICNRRQGYGLVSKMDLITGRVIGHPEGYGFLIPDEGGDDLFISPRQMRSLLHGDRAVMRLAGIDQRGRREGALVEVLERNTLRVVGRFFQERGLGFVLPDNRRIHQDILIPPEYQNDAQPGQIVIAEIIEQPSKKSRPIGRVKEVLGDHMAPGMEVEIAIAGYDIPTEWPAAVLAETECFAPEVPESATRDRWDVRGLPLVTIDGVTARDFDDAVYCERRGQNWRLLVAIADVSHYVHPGAALDEEAQRRGNSVYFPDRVIPMLPEVLSNGLCSLNPRVDRLCMICDMTLNDEGRVLRSRFVEAVMRSHARLTYDAVAAMLVERNTPVREEYGELLPHLDNLYGLFRILLRAREARGTIDFETQETVIEYGADRKIERIVPTERNDAHRLIEECMIAANVAAARFLRRHRMPTLYRIHAGPSREKLERLRGFLGELGLRLGGGDEPTPKDYAQLLERVRERPDAHLVQTVLLRSLAQAVYSPAKEAHFGLAHEQYTHFTSPIRRYPDLLVHRAIRHVLRGGKPAGFFYTPVQMLSLGEHCSMTERRADEATRDAVEWLKCEFMLDKIGDVFEGTVSSVTAFGLFVELREFFVEGLVHVTALSNDYYHFDPVGHRLRGKNTGQTYRLGDTLQVRVIRVDLDDRKIDFELVAPPRAAPKRAPRPKSRKRRRS
ncbi:MAG: ribonuclease R [Gammaproteobacteria bacterium]|nr:ribonuclease R [Gammaproteobacteria bacterium]